MKEFWVILRFWYRVAVLIMLVMILLSLEANAADYAIVDFENAEHLGALQDSVVGVKDSIKVTEDRKISNGVWEMEWHWEITCRRLVGVTVVPEPYGLNTYTTGAIIDVRQQAIIFYEEVKQ